MAGRAGGEGGGRRSICPQQRSRPPDHAKHIQKWGCVSMKRGPSGLPVWALGSRVGTAKVHPFMRQRRRRPEIYLERSHPRGANSREPVLVGRSSTQRSVIRNGSSAAAAICSLAMIATLLVYSTVQMSEIGNWTVEHYSTVSLFRSFNAGCSHT